MSDLGMWQVKYRLAHPDGQIEVHSEGVFLENIVNSIIEFF